MPLLILSAAGDRFTVPGAARLDGSRQDVPSQLRRRRDAAGDQLRAPVVYEWRCAARSTESASTLTAVDVALTATGLAAEIAECVERLKALT